MSNWRSIDERPPLDVAILLRGERGGLYVGYAKDARNGNLIYRVPNHRDGFVNAAWWCPIPEFDGEEGR